MRNYAVRPYHLQESDENADEEPSVELTAGDESVFLALSSFENSKRVIPKYEKVVAVPMVAF